MARNNGLDNQQSLLLNKQENELLFDVIGPRCTSLASAVVQVLFADTGNPPRWRRQFCGVACFIKDNFRRSFFIRIFDIVERTVLWEQELYHEIRYSQALPFFHTFETDECQAGLNFASEDEAHHFFSMVDDKVNLLHKKREDNLRRHAGMNHANHHTKQQQQNNHHAVKVEPNRHAAGPVQQSNHPVSTVQSVQVLPSGAEKSKNPVNMNFDDNKKKPKPRKITKQDIGMPTNFQHKQHVGWDPEKGFDYDDTDPKLQELFAKAGINISNTDSATRSFIYGFIEKELGGVNAVKNAVNVPPPHHHMNGGGAVPPPPPRSHSKGNAVQPPTPPVNNSNYRPQQPPPQRTPAVSADPRRSQPPPPPPPPPGLPPVLKGQAPSHPRPARMSAPTSASAVAAGAPPPPPPPPPPPMWGSTAPPAPPPLSMPSASSSSSHLSSPGSPDGGDARSALLDEIKRGKGLKTVDKSAQQPALLSDRDKLLSDIASGASRSSLKHVDPDKISLGKAENGQLDGMAAALARALAQRRPAVEAQDESDEEEAETDDDEWD